MKSNKEITAKIARLFPQIDETSAEKKAASEYAVFIAPIVAAAEKAKPKNGQPA